MLNRILRRKAPPPKAADLTMKKAADAAELHAALDVLGREWMYGFDLGHGVRIDAYSEYLAESHDTRWRMIEPELRRVFGGRWPQVRALDVACCEGWWSYKIAALGAGDVVAFDARDMNIRRAEFVKAQQGVRNVSFRVDNAVSLDPAAYGTFDLVLCLGLLYHLEDPVAALRRLRAVTKELCVIETEVARPATIDVDRGLHDGLLTTDRVMAIAEEPYYEQVSIASVTGISFIPTLAALRFMLEAVGFRDIRLAPPVERSDERHRTGDRVVVFASI